MLQLPIVRGRGTRAYDCMDGGANSSLSVSTALQDGALVTLDRVPWSNACNFIPGVNEAIACFVIPGCHK